MTASPNANRASSRGDEETQPRLGARAAARIDRTERDRQIIELARSGLTYDRIGHTVDLSEAQVSRVITRELAKAASRLDAETQQLRRLEADRLDRLQLALWSKALNGNLGATDRVLRIMERRAKLLALDLPAATEDGGGVPFIVQINSAVIPPRMPEVEVLELEAVQS